MVAIPSFIQGISTIPEELKNKIKLEGRNPFLYSGHFNIIIYRNAVIPEVPKVAIPSFIQGISTPIWGRADGWDWLIVAIPSFIQGISTVIRCGAIPIGG